MVRTKRGNVVIKPLGCVVANSCVDVEEVASPLEGSTGGEVDIAQGHLCRKAVSVWTPSPDGGEPRGEGGERTYWSTRSVAFCDFEWGSVNRASKGGTDNGEEFHGEHHCVGWRRRGGLETLESSGNAQTAAGWVKKNSTEARSLVPQSFCTKTWAEQTTIREVRVAWLP